MTVTSTIPTEAGPDTICECIHWYEEHQDWLTVADDADPEPFGPALGCGAPGCVCTAFVFSAIWTTPENIADRGGDPDKWPEWMKQALAPVTKGTDR